MPALLYIPWFKLDAWDAPLQIPGVLVAVAVMFAAPQLDALANRLGVPAGLLTRHATWVVVLGYGVGHLIGAVLGLEPYTLAIQPFGVLVATGVLAGARLAEWRAGKLGLRRELVSDHIAHVVIIGFVLGHMYDAIFYTPEELLEDPLYLLKFWTGLSSFGGFFGAAIGAFIWRWRRGVPLVPFFDQVAFGLPLGWFFGRLGCFVVHDHPGEVSDFFLAVDNYPYQGVVAPRHDLGLYEVIWSALVVPLFLYLQRKPRPHGFFIGLIAILYAPVRFGLDFLRVADKTYYGGFLTWGHVSAGISLALGVYMLWRAYRKPPPELPPQALARPVEEAAAA